MTAYIVIGLTLSTSFLAKLLWQLSSIWQWNGRSTSLSPPSEVQTKIHLGPLNTSEDTSKNSTEIPVKIRNRNWKFSQQYYLRTLKTSKNMHKDLPGNPGKLLGTYSIWKSYSTKAFECLYLIYLVTVVKMCLYYWYLEVN